MLLAISTD